MKEGKSKRGREGGREEWREGDRLLALRFHQTYDLNPEGKTPGVAHTIPSLRFGDATAGVGAKAGVRTGAQVQGPEVPGAERCFCRALLAQRVMVSCSIVSFFFFHRPSSSSAQLLCFKRADARSKTVDCWSLASICKESSPTILASVTCVIGIIRWITKSSSSNNCPFTSTS